ncbi:hypothetical protein BOTBODRAFT_53766 [Botryobasidium botryosum FD-172 SS1]|uniref:Amine oxidase domain-containing protein n=1 Tax=Botryobasidium botryosum (strain FD-172 SS1) TaxID=930990 RepID=A0A067MYN4_BOTB1|nr:hypothetical protein BOTBODRAFT_53766 [Botryobasidium botryosum FD-172 SS1]
MDSAGFPHLWHAKYAREHARRFQLEQIASVTRSQAPPSNSTSAGCNNLHPFSHPTPIPVPAPILHDHSDGLLNLQKDAGNILVGIVGAGAAGLYTAMILDDLEISYEILESSDRVGGRVHTHHFPGDNKWNYFEMGAMRFPSGPMMYRVNDLLQSRLGLGDKLLPQLMTDLDGNQILEYNGIRRFQKEVEASPNTDWFNDSTENGGSVPPEFIKRGLVDLLVAPFAPFREAFLESWSKGWEMLLKYDQHTIRSFFGTEFDDGFLKKEAYPSEVINWMEAVTGSGVSSVALSEIILTVLKVDRTSMHDWHCVAGGSSVFIEAMIERLSSKPQLSRRVTRIAPTADPTRPMSVAHIDAKTNSSTSTSTSRYDYVISTMPLPNLRFVDMEKCNPGHGQRQAIRSLTYNPSVKIGIKFKSRWWQERCGIKGGSSRTDRIVREVVYPSYGIHDPGADGVLIATYVMAQDAQRFASLIKGHDTPEEKLLIDLVLNDLTALHGFDDPEFLREQYVDHLAWNWAADPNAAGLYSHFLLAHYTFACQLAGLTGGYAMFGPSQFGDVYASCGQPAAGGRLFFAGEALSENHAWVEGALSSAYEAIHKLLYAANLEDKLGQLRERWGNPNLPEYEESDMRKVMNDQAFLGALFSSGRARDACAEALDEYLFSSDWEFVEG